MVIRESITDDLFLCKQCGRYIHREIYASHENNHIRENLKLLEDSGFNPEVTEGSYEPAKDKSYREVVLENAHNCVMRDRNNTYGPPHQDFQRTADLWSTYLSRGKEPVKIAPHDVAVMLILLKCSRLSWSPGHEDNWVDIAGYAACGLEAFQLGAANA